MAVDPIDQQLQQLVADQKAFNARMEEQMKSLGGITPETKAEFEKFREEFKKLLDHVDEQDARNTHRLVKQIEAKSLGSMITETEEFKAAQGIEFRRSMHLALPSGSYGVPQIDRTKAVISGGGLGFATSGVLTPVRIPGVFGMPMQELRVRDVMQVRQQTTGSSFDWLKQTTRTNAASPQVEGSAKSESTYNWATATDKIRTIAHYVNVTTQALDDIPGLRQTIDTELIYGLKLKEEAEILTGPGTGEHLNGIITQATAFTDPSITGETKLDKLRLMKLQARLAGLGTYPPDAIVINPTDLAYIDLIKQQASGVGSYVVGDPAGQPQTYRTLWGLPVIESDSLAAGQAVVGAFSTAAVLIDRMAMTVDISLEHNVNFTSNIATIRAEERIGLAVLVPTAFIYAASL